MESTLPLTISAQYGLVDQVTYFNNRVASQNISNYYLVKNGEFAYNKSSSDGYPFGAVKRLDLYEMGVLSTLYIVFALKNPNVNSDFLACYYDTDNWHKQVSERAAEGARNHGLLNISADDFLDTELMIPPEKEEQAIIGSYLKKLDNLITLHQRKYDKLVNIKKSMLEKMFPRDGAKVPEIRFKGFTDAWEQRKLNQIADIIVGGTPSTSNSEYWDGGIDWYAPAEIGGQIYADGSVRKITELGLQNSSATVLPANRTILFTSRAGIGKTAILRRPGATNQGFQSIVLKDGFNPYFIFSMSDSIKGKAEAVASGSTFLEISGKALGNLDVMLPNKQEQDQIAGCFEALDTLITLHQRKLEKLKNMKKSMLEKMFV